MKLRKIAAATVLAGLGFLYMGSNASAYAAGAPSTGPQSAASSAEGDGVASGNSIAAPIAIPIEVCSNANGIGVLGLGVGFSACDVSVFSGGGGAGPVAGPQQAASSADGDGVLAGNSAAVPVAVPVEVACNLNGIGGAGVGIGGSFCDVSAFSH